ncbi:MAG: hypothetical protein JWP08_4414, partial [Bryobacterales bacterium]|nr:hypothetical protein [Bryobacterales bacterium]
VIDQATDISASRTAIFRRGTTVIRVRFNTFMDGHHLTAAESDRILQLAVAKAVR